jgi:hypothetical protein
VGVSLDLGIVARQPAQPAKPPGLVAAPVTHDERDPPVLAEREVAHRRPGRTRASSGLELVRSLRSR